MTRRLARWLLPLLGLWFVPLWVLAQGLQPIPELRARVIDQTGTLDAARVAAIEAKLAAFEQAKGSQVVVVMVQVVEGTNYRVAFSVDCDADDLIVSPAVTGTDASWLKPSLKAAGLDPDLLRISVGLEPIEEIWTAFEAALAK